MLTEKQERFCLNYVESNNATQAAENAGYSLKTAYSIGSENLKKPEIASRINEIREKNRQDMLERTIAKKEEAAQIVTEILRARFSDFDIDNLTKEQMNNPALREVTRTHFTGGKEGRAVQTSTKIKLDSPLQAVEQLAKLFGWYENAPVGFQDRRTINIIVSDDKAKELTEGIGKAFLTEGNRESDNDN
jgi:hypothetical protein